jgi:hypothetical protein
MRASLVALVLAAIAARPSAATASGTSLRITYWEDSRSRSRA